MDERLRRLGDSPHKTTGGPFRPALLTAMIIGREHYRRLKGELFHIIFLKASVAKATRLESEACPVEDVFQHQKNAFYSLFGDNLGSPRS